MGTTDDGYNGWTNWDTWDAFNWLSSDEYLYRQTHGGDADDMRTVFNSAKASGFITDDIDPNAVDWQEIADAINDEGTGSA